MAVTANTSVDQTFIINAPINEVWLVLSDIERSAEHYPDVQTVVDLGDGAYRWEFVPTGVGKFSHQIIYSCQYETNEAVHHIAWRPIPNTGDTKISGNIVLKSIDQTTEVTFKTNGELTLPVPRFMKAVATTYGQGEFDKQIAVYIKNLQGAFD